MSFTAIYNTIFPTFFTIASFLCCLLYGPGTYAFATSCSDYYAVPPFLPGQLKPNVLFMLDNSGSMKTPLYDKAGSWKNDCSKDPGQGYNQEKEYAGLFNAEDTYYYDSDIPIDISSFSNGALGYQVAIDPSQTGAFIRSSTDCSLESGLNCWDGNFLNWLTTRRIDGVRKVLIGGKTETRSGFDYLLRGDLQWKLVANNEPEDNHICKTVASVQSPFPGNTHYHIYSPVDSGKIADQYAPYAKIEPVPQQPLSLRDISNRIIGEIGAVENITPGQQVFLTNSYLKPIITIQLSIGNQYYTPEIQIHYLQGVAHSFSLKEDSKLLKKTSTAPPATLTYCILEQGNHLFAGNIRLIADEIIFEPGSSALKKVALNGFADTPLVFTSASTPDNTTPTATVRNLNLSGFEVGVASDTPHGTVTHQTPIHYLAIDQGKGQSGQVTFSSKKRPPEKPHRYTTTYTFQTEWQNEPSSYTSEQDNSLRNTVPVSHKHSGYLQFTLPHYNIALIIDEEPQGLLSQIQNNVRVGLSFYRYQLDDNIYKSEWAHGGTMQLPIPVNPFIKDADQISKFRIINTPVNTSPDEIIDGIEHYPLVWGTTPLAENLFEIGNYFSQSEPFYSNKPVIHDNNDQTIQPYLVNQLWDPYMHSTTNGIYPAPCIQSSVIVVTDGLPVKDDYLPEEIVGTQERDEDDYDFDDTSHTAGSADQDCSKTTDKSDSCKNNLDDVAKYLHWDNLTDRHRDLREDLDGTQYLQVYTIGFGPEARSAILEDCAENGGGFYRYASDSVELENSLTEAVNRIIGKTSSGTSLSVLAEHNTNGSLVNQALFYPIKTFEDSLYGSSFDVTWGGNLTTYWYYNSNTTANFREDTLKNYGLDIYEDKGLVFSLDEEDGSVEIQRYRIIQDGEGSGSLNLYSGPDGAEGPEHTYQHSDEIEQVFDVGSQLASRKVVGDPDEFDSTRRLVFSVGDENTLIEFTHANADYFKEHFRLDPQYTSQCLGTFSTPASKKNAALNLISYVRGASDSFIENESDTTITCRNRKINNNGDLWKLGDIIYSTPQTVKYNHNGEKFSVIFVGANDGMLHAFHTGQLSKTYAGINQDIVLCDSSFGCSQSDLGRELWSFIPQNAMPYLQFLADPNYRHIYSVDLPPYIIEDEGRKILIGGMRLGGATGCVQDDGSHWCGDFDRDGVIDRNSSGNPVQLLPPGGSTLTAENVGLSSYFALDITDPTNPVFLWEFSHPSMGLSYSGPAYIKRSLGDTTQKYILFLSGPLNSRADFNNSPLAQDVKLFVLKLGAEFTLENSSLTSESVFGFDGQGEEGFHQLEVLKSLSSGFGGRLFTTGIDSNKDNSTDIIFFGVNRFSPSDSTWQGNVYYIAPNDDSPVGSESEVSTWEIGKVFSDWQQPITSKVVHGTCFNNNYIYFGSGRWFHKLDTPGTPFVDSNSIWGIEIDECLDALTDEDLDTSCATSITRNHNGMSEHDFCSETGLAESLGEISWQLDELEPNQDEDYLMERTITDPFVYANAVFFTTMEPDANLCKAGGRTRVWGLNCRTGHSMLSGCLDIIPEIPEGNLLLQLSNGNIETITPQSSYSGIQDQFSFLKYTDWYMGTPPETSPKFLLPGSGQLSGEVLLWIER